MNNTVHMILPETLPTISAEQFAMIQGIAPALYRPEQASARDNLHRDALAAFLDDYRKGIDCRPVSGSDDIDFAHLMDI